MVKPASTDAALSGGCKSSRILMLGSGKADDCNEAAFNKIIGSLISTVASSGISKLQLCVDDINVKSRDAA